ncbi:MAG TPA: helix-turn-helix domain-containing protein [Novosphingobium sp.]|nr:helix-turn-helix domain-containing protein [Novosphingobium sp.]
MRTDSAMSGSDRVERSIHSGLVPPPPGWAMEYTQLTSALGQGECRDLFLPGLLLRSCSAQTTLSMSGCGEPERHIFVILSNMRGQGRLNGRPLGEGLTAVCGAQPFEAILPPMEMLGLTVSRALVDDYLETIEGMVAPAWMHNGIHMVGDIQSVARVARKLKALIAQHYTDPAAPMDDEGRGGMIASVLDILLPLIIDTDASTDYGWSNRYEIVRRAREYILDRIEEPLRISDICRDLGVSRRRLQYSFQEVLGINPIAFLRILRLNRARHDLVRIGGALQVKDVIDRWGFWHPSRFSREYKQMFEELPSETLRRCRAV